MTADKRGLFDVIAPYYGLFFNFQVKYYQKILNRVAQELDEVNYKNIIDVGCGTGALCYVLNRQGLSVTGVDAEPGMLKIAEKKLQNSPVCLVQADAFGKLPFNDKSFDVAISSYVIHGMPAARREIFYTEMNRIARYKVIFHDYNDKRSFLTSLVEWLEKGDYFNFIKQAKKEIADNFKDLRVVQVDKRAAWYICTPFNTETEKSQRVTSLLYNITSY